MYALISIGLLAAAILTIAALYLTRRSLGLAWPAAAIGGVLAWGSVLFWQLGLPVQLPSIVWNPSTLFLSSPYFLADSYSWMYAFSLGALAAAVILTSPAHRQTLSPVPWLGTLALALFAILAVMADNLLSLALVWTALDLAEYVNTLQASNTPALNERAVVALFFRVLGTGFALWASVVGAAAGVLSTLENTPAQAGIFMLLAVGLRLGVIPLHLAFRSDPGFRRELGTSLRLTAAATSLAVLARLPSGVVDSAFIPYLLAFVAVAALYAGWKWLSLPDEITARPYWLIGMSALSLAGALRGSPAASAAWGAALVLFGGISFLYSSRQVWFTRIFAVLGLLLLSLPFTLTASGWEGAFPAPFLFWPLFLLAHALLVVGYLRHILRVRGMPFAELPRWAQTAYPLGLGILAFSTLLLGVWGWPGSLQAGRWQVGIVLAVLAGLGGLAFWRLRIIPGDSGVETAGVSVSHMEQFQDALASWLWGIYRFLGRAVNYISNLLEGDGGLLWTMLILVLFLVALRGG